MFQLCQVSYSVGGYPGYWTYYGVGARALGMGQSFVGISDDVTAIYFNPAGIGQILKPSFSIMHTELFYSTKYDFLGFVLSATESWSSGIGYLQLLKQDIISRNEYNYPVGTLTDKKSIIFLTNSFVLIPKLWIGINAKILKETFDDINNTGYGFDVGFLTKQFSFLSVGLNLQNIVQPSLGKQTVPTNIRFGIGLNLFDRKLNVSIELNIMDSRLGMSGMTAGENRMSGMTPGENRMSAKTDEIKIGAEYLIKRIFAIRAGVSSTDTTPAMGIGFKKRNFGIDYAILNHNVLGLSHRVSMDISFGKTIEEIEAERKEKAEKERRQKQAKELLEEVKQSLDEGNLAGAKSDIQVALKTDPENEEIKEMLSLIEKISKDLEPPYIDIPAEILWTNTGDFIKTIKIEDNVGLKSVYVDDKEQKMLMKKTGDCFIKKTLISGTNKVIIKAVDMNDNEIQKDIPIIFDKELPKIQILLPKEKKFTSKNDILELQITVSDENQLKELEITGLDKKVISGKEISGKEYNYTDKIILKDGKKYNRSKCY